MPQNRPHLALPLAVRIFIDTTPCKVEDDHGISRSFEGNEADFKKETIMSLTLREVAYAKKAPGARGTRMGATGASSVGSISWWGSRTLAARHHYHLVWTAQMPEVLSEGSATQPQAVPVVAVQNQIARTQTRDGGIQQRMQPPDFAGDGIRRRRNIVIVGYGITHWNTHLRDG